MIIFLYGQDSYRLKQAKDEIIKRYKIKYPSGFNLFSFDVLDTQSSDMVEDALKSVSFFGEHKLILSRNVFSKKSQADIIFKYINKYNLINDRDITFLMAEDYSDKDILIKHKELAELLISKSSLVKRIDPLEGAKLGEWVREEFRARGRVIDPAALNKLISISGNNTWRLVNEIDKLSNYKKLGKISSVDIDSLVNIGIDINIFNLIDAIAQKNNGNALKFLYQETKTGQDLYYILTMIVHQFRNILTAKDLKNQGYSENEIAKKAKLHPFVIKKSLSSPFSIEEAINVYNKLLAIDIGFKKGQIDLEDSLYKLAVT